MRASAPALCAVVAAAVLVVGGCSGEEDGPTPSGASSSSVIPTASLAPSTDPAPTGAAPTGPATPGVDPTPTVSPPAATPSGTTSSGPEEAEGARPTAGAPATMPVGTPTVGVRTLAPVQSGEDAVLSDGLVIIVEGVREQQVTATEPGDISGPAVVVSVRARNSTSAPVDLSQLVVTATLAGAPASPTRAGPAQDLSGQLGPGRTATGAYVFRLDGAAVDELRLQVGSGDSETVVVVDP